MKQTANCVRKIICAYFSLFCFKALFAQEIQQKTLVNIKVVEADTRNITPVMVCITNVKDTFARLPPHGDIAGAPTEIPVFMNGIEFSNDKNWVGPVRMTNGLGNNDNRSG